MKFEYELTLSDETQERYSEMSEACVLPIISHYLVDACKGVDRDMTTIIDGFYYIYKRLGKEGLKQCNQEISNMVTHATVVETEESLNAKKRIMEMF